MSPPPASTDLKRDPDQIVLLRDLLTELHESFKTITTTDVDDVYLRNGFEELSGLLEEFHDDFRARLDFFRELDRALAVQDERDVYFSRLDRGEESASELKAHVIESWQRIKAVEPTMETVFKMTSMRSNLNRIGNAGSRRIIAQALTSASVVVDRVRDLRSEVRDALKDLSERQLIAKLGVPDESTIQLPTQLSSPDVARTRKAAASAPPKPRPGRSEKEPRRDVSSTTGERAPKPAAGSGETPSGNKASASSGRSREAAKEKGPLSPNEFKRIRSVLNRWSRWYPLTPSNLGDLVGVISAEDESAVKLDVKTLWGVRARDTVSVPYQDNSVNSLHVASLWDIPASPPEEFEAGTEDSQVPGDERVVEKKDADGKVSKQFEYQVCKTQYVPTELWETDYDGELPRDLLESAEGTSRHESFTALDDQRVAHDLEKKCVDGIRGDVSPYFLKEVVERHFRGPTILVDDGNEGQEKRLVRAQMELFRVPIICLTCGFRDASHPKATSRFRVWVYGSQQRLHFDQLPKMWTQKATAWMAGLVAGAAGVGFLLGKLAQWMA